jgi:hypothetical protein
VLLGEIVRVLLCMSSCGHSFTSSCQDLDQEDDVPLRQVDYQFLDPYHKNDIANKKDREEFKAKVLYEQKGFCKEGGEGDGY